MLTLRALFDIVHGLPRTQLVVIGHAILFAGHGWVYDAVAIPTSGEQALRAVANIPSRPHGKLSGLSKRRKDTGAVGRGAEIQL